MIPVILVTGATGRLGRNLVKFLMERDYKIRVLVREKEKADAFGKNVEVFVGDLLDYQSLLKATKNVDIVIHLAALIDYSDKKKIMKVNYEGTKNIATASLANNVKKFIFCSSVAIYGKPRYLPIDEEHPCKPQNPYGLSKLRAEQFLKNMKIPYVILRPTVIYGAGFEEGFNHVFNAIKKGKMKIIGNGKNKIHFLHVDDMVSAIYLAIKTDKAIGNEFNISGGEIITQKESFEIAADLLTVPAPSAHIPKSLVYLLSWLEEKKAKILKKTPKMTTEHVKVIAENRFFSIKKAEKILKYNPKKHYADGIKEMLAAAGILQNADA